MSTNRRIYIGLAITAIVFLLSILVARWYDTGIDFIPNSFVTHTTMLILSILVIILLGPQVNYVIKWPSLRKTLMPILLGIVVSIAINIILTVITNAIGGKVEAHPVLAKYPHCKLSSSCLSMQALPRRCCSGAFCRISLNPWQAKGYQYLAVKYHYPLLSALYYSVYRI